MMSKKNLFGCATDALKEGVKGALSGVIATVVVVPIMGLVAHGVKYMSDERLDGYSLRNRFETAYCFNTPNEHKYYYSTPVIFGYEAEGDTVRESYLASPYATYGIIGLGGVAGAGLALAGRRKKER